MTTPDAPRADRRDVGYGLGFIALVAVFWVQRDPPEGQSTVFADSVLIMTAVLALILVVRALWKPAPRSSEASGSQLRSALWALGLLSLWFVALVVVGYVAAGVAFFALIATVMRGDTPRLGPVLRDVAAAAIGVAAIYVIFVELLLVRLPTPGL